jgi:hypothetical protein
MQFYYTAGAIFQYSNRSIPGTVTLWEFFFGKAFFIIWRDRSAKDVTVEQTPTPAASGPDNQPTARRVS